MLRTVKTWAALTALCGLALTPLCGGAAAGENKTLKVGFVYVSPVGDEGWSYAHDQGRKAIDAMPGVETTFMESVPEGPDSEPGLSEHGPQGIRCDRGNQFRLYGFHGKSGPDSSRRRPSCTVPATRRMKT